MERPSKETSPPNRGGKTLRILAELGVAYVALFIFGMVVCQGSFREVLLGLSVFGFPVFSLVYVPIRLVTLYRGMYSSLDHLGCLLSIGFLALVVACLSFPPIVTQVMKQIMNVRMRWTFQDLRDAKGAVATYYLDWGSFPTPAVAEERGNRWRVLPPCLTTPIPYLKSLPKDPYIGYGNHPVGYWVSPATGEDSGIRVILHADGICGWRHLPSDEELDSMERVTRDWLYQFQFSPTNGIKAPDGDLLVWGGGGEEPGNNEGLKTPR